MTLSSKCFTIFPHTFPRAMHRLRIVSITASAVILVIAIAAVLFALHFEWHRYKEIRKCRPSSFWKSILDPGITFVITAGLSISLLICSISWDEKWIEILLLLFGRFLLMRQVSTLYIRTHRLNTDQSQAIFLWRLLPCIQIESRPGSALFKYLRWIIICVSGGLFGFSLFIVVEVARTQYRDTILEYGLKSFAGEFLGLSISYAYLTCYSRHPGTSLSRYYGLILAILTAVLGCLSAFILCLLKPGHRISWVSALWVSIPSHIVSGVFTN